MLYNPNWKETETKQDKGQDKGQLTTLVAWLERQNLTQTYTYTDGSGCLLAQYFGTKVTSSHIHQRDGSLAYLPKWFNAIARGGSCVRWELTFPKNISKAHNFGAALERAKYALSQEAA